MSTDRLEGVSKTAILTLRARADEHGRSDRIYEDPRAVDWMEKIAWPSELDGWYSPRVQSLLALRAHELDRLVEQAAARHDVASVVELGCGLSTRRERLADHQISSWMDVDLEGVIALRRSLGVEHRMIACSVLDDAWMAEVEEPAKTLLIAEGLLYYLPRREVDALFLRMRHRLAGALILFDVLGEMDFEAARKNSTSAGTPIVWKVDGFTRTFEDLGVEIVAGWEPEATMEAAIDLYWPRFGRIAHRTIKLLSKVRALAELRSGTIAGRLRAAAR